jgi:hypothetical protein
MLQSRFEPANAGKEVNDDHLLLCVPEIKSEATSCQHPSG